MAGVNRRVCMFLLMFAAAMLLVASAPTSTSSELEEVDLFTGRELLQDVQAERFKKNNTGSQCNYYTTNWSPSGGYRRYCGGRCTYNCKSGEWKCYGCRKRRYGCRNTQHSYSFSDGCRSLDYDDRGCGRMYCRDYGK